MKVIILDIESPEYKIFKQLQSTINDEKYDAFRAGFVHGMTITNKISGKQKEDVIQEAFKLYMEVNAEDISTIKYAIIQEEKP